MKSFFGLITVLIFFNSCAQKNNYDMRDYIEFKRGTHSIGNSILPFVVYYKNKYDTNYTLLKDYVDGSFKNQVAQYFYYKNVLDGPYQTFDINGDLKESGFFKKGKQAEERIKYSGKIMIQKGFFENGVKVGIWKEYDKYGNITRKTKYKNGEIVEDSFIKK